MHETFYARWWKRAYTLFQRHQAYNLALRQPAGEIVVADLLTFCGVADEAPRGASEFEQGRAAGRRDVGLRLMEHLHLSPEELYAVIQGRSILRQQSLGGKNVRAS